MDVTSAGPLWQPEISRPGQAFGHGEGSWLCMSPFRRVGGVAFRSVAVSMRHLQIVGVMQPVFPLAAGNRPKAAPRALQIEQAELLWDNVFDLGVSGGHPQSAQPAAVIVPPPQVSHYGVPVLGVPFTGRTVRLFPLHQPTLCPPDKIMRVAFQILIAHCGTCLLSVAAAVSPWLSAQDRDRNRSHRDSHTQHSLECYDPTRCTIDRICLTTQLDWYWLGRSRT